MQATLLHRTRIRGSSHRLTKIKCNLGLYHPTKSLVVSRSEIEPYESQRNTQYQHSAFSRTCDLHITCRDRILCGSAGLHRARFSLRHLTDPCITSRVITFKPSGTVTYFHGRPFDKGSRQFFLNKCNISNMLIKTVTLFHHSIIVWSCNTWEES